jgi:hypothetical protein
MMMAIRRGLNSVRGGQEGKVWKLRERGVKVQRRERQEAFEAAV